MSDLTGQVFGRLTVIRRIGTRGTAPLWLCHCECGNDHAVVTSSLKDGYTRSCGCLRREVVGERSLRHGQSRRKVKTPTHTSWAQMIQRCSDQNCRDWQRYGARGITVCDRWRAFENFYADMGERPSTAHSIDRIDNNGNYEPGNCRWATSKQQQRNRRGIRLVEYKGRTQCMSAWDEEYGLREGAVGDCLRRGRSLEKLLSGAGA